MCILNHWKLHLALKKLFFLIFQVFYQSLITTLKKYLLGSFCRNTSVVFYHHTSNATTAVWSKLWKRNHSSRATNFICHAYPSFYSSRHSWTWPQTCGFTSKEQTIINRAGEHVTELVRMRSRRGVYTANEGMVWPMEEHEVHERGSGGAWVRGCAVMVTWIIKLLKYSTNMVMNKPYRVC